MANVDVLVRAVVRLMVKMRDHKLTHGDFHDGNIAFNKNREAVVIDFGMSDWRRYDKGLDAEIFVTTLMYYRSPFVRAFAEQMQNTLGPDPVGRWALPTYYIKGDTRRLGRLVHEAVGSRDYWLNADKVVVPSRTKTWSQLAAEYM